MKCQPVRCSGKRLESPRATFFFADQRKHTGTDACSSADHLPVCPRSWVPAHLSVASGSRPGNGGSEGDDRVEKVKHLIPSELLN